MKKEKESFRSVDQCAERAIRTRAMSLACASRQRGQCLRWFSSIRIHTVNQVDGSVSSSHSEVSALPRLSAPRKPNESLDLYSYPKHPSPFRSLKIICTDIVGKQCANATIISNVIWIMSNGLCRDYVVPLYQALRSIYTNKHCLQIIAYAHIVRQ